MLFVSLCLLSGRRLERCLPLESLGQAGSLAQAQLLVLGEDGSASSPLFSLGVPILPQVRAQSGWATLNMLWLTLLTGHLAQAVQ